MKLSIRFQNLVEQNRDRIFAIDAINDTHYTFAEFQHLALSLSARFLNHGIEKGYRVALLLQNSIEYAVSYFTCLYSGFVAVPVNLSLHPTTIEYIIATAQVRAIVYSPDTLTFAWPLLRGRPEIRSFCLCPEYALLESLPESLVIRLSELSGEVLSFAPSHDIDSDDIYTITFTSGTTAKPKGIFHTIGNYVTAAELFNATLSIAESDRFYHILPMGYMAGFLNLLFLPFMAGASCVICPAFDARLAIQFWKIPIKFGTNRFWLVPSILAMLMKIDRDSAGLQYCRNQVRDIFVGTAPLPLALRKEFEDKYQIPIYESYGLTEAMFVATNSPQRKMKQGSVGHLLDGVSLRVGSDEECHKNCAQDAELFIKSPTIMVGYLNESTSEPDCFDRTGWFPTGDIGRVDDDGYVFITDRQKDIIIKGGINISPRAIEEVLLSHPQVEQAAVVGVPHGIYGEDVAAAVVLKDRATLDFYLPSLKELCRQRLEAYCVPASFTAVDHLPSGPTGKLLKRQIRELLLLENGSESRASDKP